TDQADSELEFLGNLVAATSRGTTQSTMPVTPMMDTEVYLTTYPTKVNSHFYNPCIDSASVAAAPMGAVSAASGQFFMGGAKDYEDESAFTHYQQLPLASGTLPRTIPYPASQRYSPAMTAQAYAYSPAELGAHLHGIAMAASSTPTPQIHVASPELLSIGGGGAGQLGVAMSENDLLSQIVYQAHASTPRLSSSHCSVGGMDMGALLPADDALLYSMPITGPAPGPSEPLFMPASYADMSSSGSRRSSGAAGAAAYAPNSEIVAHSSGGLAGEHLHASAYHVGQHRIPSLSQNNGMLREGQHAFSCPDSFVIGTPVMSAGQSLDATALSHSFTSGFSEISLSSSRSGSQAVSPAFSSQTLSGVIRNSSRLARMRPGRSLSISEPFHAHTPSPVLSTLGAAPHTSAHPYFPSSPYQTFGSALSPNMGVASLSLHSGGQADAHYTGGSEAGKSYSEGAWQHPKSNSSSRLALLRSKSGPHTRPQQRAARSALGSPPTVAAVSLPASIASYDSYSSDDGHGGSEPAGSRVQAEQGAKLPNLRTPLTPMQREVFFRWLYNNTHDPKPKGKERDRLREIGNMSRERFKTWFANARRRYFTVTLENGVQKYTMNSRFIVACQRANINLNE
ncbi:hypothetical protein GGI00_003672, partial [Coemansia sp. RSA 2681]